MSSMLSTYDRDERSHPRVCEGSALSAVVEARSDGLRRVVFVQDAAAPESTKRMNLAGIDLVSLRLVVLCAETQSLSVAARQLNMSLSCASHRLSQLEQRFRTRLFDRGYQGLRQTAAGRIFVMHVTVSLDIIRSCRDRIALLSNELANRNAEDWPIAMGVEK